MDDFFGVHGFVVVRELLRPAEAAELRDEVSRSLDAHYGLPGSRLTEATGTAGLYLPMVGPATPVSRELLVSDQLMGLAAKLLGSDVVPKPAKGILYRDASPWHCDSADPYLRAIKAVAYLDPLTGADGALQVLPGSHEPESSARLTRYRERNPAGVPVFDECTESALWPGVALETRPGDVIIFDVRLWHASLLGRDRLQWSASYAATPHDEHERVAVRSYIDSFLSAGHALDLTAFPYYDPSWSGPDRPPFADVLADLGLIELEPDCDRNHR